MQNRVSRSVVTLLLAVGITGFMSACASMKEGKEKKEEAAQSVSLAQLPAAPRATVERLTTGGQVEKISKEVEKGKTVYDVEATVGGKHVEYLIADADGAVLGTETSIEYSELPAAVRAAAEKYFGTATGLKPMKGVEGGETTYEIEGTRKGKTATATFDPTGKLQEEE